MNRRQFLQSSLALAALALVGKELQGNGDVIEIVECIIDDDAIVQHIKLGRMFKRNGKLFVDVSVDSDAIMDTVVFIDSNGKRYSYREMEEMAECYS